MSSVSPLLQATLDRYLASACPGVILAVDAPALGIAFTGARGLFARGTPKRASVTKAITAATVVAEPLGTKFL